MKTLILYLSATGNTARLAQEIANRMESVDLVPIMLKTTIPKNHFWLNMKFGFLMSMNWGFRYVVPEIDIDEYDQILIGTPVWMGRAAPPLLKVINKFNLGHKINSVFVTYGGGPGYVYKDIKTRSAVGSIENKLAVSDTDDYEDADIQNKISYFVEQLTPAKVIKLQTTDL